MIFDATPGQAVYVAMRDATNVLSACSRHGFELDGAEWPSVEHYYQAMKFEDAELRERIRGAAHPAEAGKLAKKYRRSMRADWNALRRTVMTRGVYTKCRMHAEAAAALRATGELKIVETSQYDYFWGCGRDGRGRNAYGEVLMAVRDKLGREAG